MRNRDSSSHNTFSVSKRKSLVALSTKSSHVIKSSTERISLLTHLFTLTVVIAIWTLFTNSVNNFNTIDVNNTWCWCGCCRLLWCGTVPINQTESLPTRLTIASTLNNSFTERILLFTGSVDSQVSFVAYLTKVRIRRWKLFTLWIPFTSFFAITV